MVGQKPVCEVWRLGVTPYEKAWKLQETLAGEVAIRKRPPVLLLLEHNHTYTFGRRGDPKNLLWSEEELAERGISLYRVDRGGDITYHGPGQLVGYPIIPLGRLSSGDKMPSLVDYVGYVRKIEQTLILSLARFGLACGQIPGKTGVWIQPDVASRCPSCDPIFKMAPSKIASIGVKVDVSGVSRHGFALNVSPDKTYWKGIVPCGLEGVTMASLDDFLDPSPEMPEVMDIVESEFSEVFGYQMAAAGCIPV